MPKGVYLHQHIKPKQYPEAMIENVRVLYGQGFTQSEIADRLGTTQKVIWRLMMRHEIWARVAAKRDQCGPKNHAWKGDGAKYQALHLRVARIRGKPQRCEVCGSVDPKRAYDWANLSGRYADVQDYARMCRSCHWKRDGKIANIRKDGGRDACA
jgi:hypothetical protein